MRRVVVTGMGMVNGLGSDALRVWETYTKGPIPRRRVQDYFDVQTHPRPYSTRTEGLIDTVCGSTLTAEDMARVLEIPQKKYEAFDRHQLFALLAAHEAMGDAGLRAHVYSDRFGCVGGTGAGGLQEAYDASVKLSKGERVRPTCNLKFLPNIFAGYVARKYRLRGPNYVHCTACAASSHAFEHAADLIQLDRADVILVTGAEAAITPKGIGSFCIQQALSNYSRPYQRERSGFLMGEGAAALILEEFEHARARGARILAEVVGWGATADGNPEAQITDPGEGGYSSMKLAVEMAGIDAKDVAYINAHGTGTPGGDEFEIQNSVRLFGTHAPHILLSSSKSAVGHLLGAAGVTEAALCILMMQAGIVLPTIGLTADNLAPECEGVDHVYEKTRRLEGDYVLSNSFGFGGTNATLVFKKFNG